MLNNNNLKLRAIELEDLNFIYNLENDPDNWFCGTNLPPYSKFTIKKFIDYSKNDISITKQLRLIIEYNKKSVGILDIFEIDFYNERAGLGIIVAKEYRNKGIASQTLNIACNYSKNILNLNQLWCQINSLNTFSINLFNKVGFKKTGEMSNWYKQGDKWISIFFMQKLL